MSAASQSHNQRAINAGLDQWSRRFRPPNPAAYRGLRRSWPAHHPSCPLPPPLSLSPFLLAAQFIFLLHLPPVIALAKLHLVALASIVIEESITHFRQFVNLFLPSVSALLLLSTIFHSFSTFFTPHPLPSVISGCFVTVTSSSSPPPASTLTSPLAPSFTVTNIPPCRIFFLLYFCLSLPHPHRHHVDDFTVRVLHSRHRV